MMSRIKARELEQKAKFKPTRDITWRGLTK